MGARPKRPDSERADDHCGDSGHPKWHVESCHAHWPSEKKSQQLDAGQQRKEEAGDQSVTAHDSSLDEVRRPPNVSFNDSLDTRRFGPSVTAGRALWHRRGTGRGLPEKCTHPDAAAIARVREPHHVRRDRKPRLVAQFEDERR